jgi:diacylglycerol kinase family enzyme
MRLFAAAMRGTHERMDPVTAFTTTRLSLALDAPPALEIDGELHGAASRSVTIDCVPRALNVIAAPGARL